ncbi:MAG: hypothetical protein H7124_07580 [Phycisphaerales bacterium]|nr:hypothetical protein [Hyphomonadaceae bacterium]
MRTLSLIAALAVAACAASSDPNPSALDAASFERELTVRFQPPPPSPAAPSLDDPRAGRIADAAYFAAYPEYERAYTPQARARARELAEQLRHTAGDLTPDQFTLRVAEIVALADNAHSQLGTAFEKNTRRAPLRTYWFADGLYVLRAAPAYADLLGARIEAIDGVAVEDVFQRIRIYNGGTEQWRRQELTPMLESPGLLHAAGVTREAEALTFSGVAADGQFFERRIEGEARGQAAPISSTTRLLYPAAPGGAMASLLARDESAPLYLRSPAFFQHEALAGDGLYVKISHNGDTDDEPIGDFLEHVRARLAQHRPAYVVVDLRMNTGGDFTSTYRFARELPSQTDRVYVLISGWTLSAAMHAAAAIEQAAPDRVTLVGAPVGDRLSFWSEGGQFVLPNAPMIVSFTTGRHNFGGPCEDLEQCFWLSALPDQYPVRVAALDPDIAAPLTFEAYRARRDPALDAVLAREAAR